MSRRSSRVNQELRQLAGVGLASALVTAMAISCATAPGSGDGAGGSVVSDGTGAGPTDTEPTYPDTNVDDPPGVVASDGSVGPNGSSLNPTAEDLVPFEVQSRAASLRKVKNLMTGFAPTPAEYDVLNAVPRTGDAVEAQGLYEAMRSLVVQWLETPEFDSKLLALFRNVFQQKGFSMQEDMKGQFLEYGPFDLNPTFSYGDTAYTRIEKNFSDSFARTALNVVKSGQPFSDVLSTRTHMVTTALIAAHLQVEQPNDAPLQFALRRSDGPTWKIDKTQDIPPEQAAATMTWDDDAATTGSGFFSNGAECDQHDYSGANGGSALLFQRLIGLTPRWNYVANPECWEHPSKPYFEPQDTEDWRLITFTQGAPTVKPWDIAAIRAIGGGSSVSLNLPRVGFYTTPAFLALWRTNDSNQHRVTANQTLMAALGAGFTKEQEVTPVTTVGLDDEHSTTGTECYGCHKSLDPLREFWENQFDYNDRNDYADNQQPSTGDGGFSFGGTATRARPATRGGALAFDNVNAAGADIDGLGPLLLQVTDSAGMPRFALNMAQQLCYWADSAGCGEGDAEFRRIAQIFTDSGYDFKLLVAEMMASPLVTGFSPTVTFEARNMVVSVTRRDHICAALGSRLDLGDVCGLDYAFPQGSAFGATAGNADADAIKAVFRIAGTISADAFSRGSELPVTPSIPTLFYAAGTELLCENVASQVVGTLYSTADIAAAIEDMVANVMGYTSNETLADGSSPGAAAVALLTEYYNAAAAESDATNALKSTFALACQAPTSLGIGM